MPRHGGPMKVGEKSKDFKGTMIKLFKSLNKWKSLVIVSLLLALLSALLSTIAPNRLSKLTDVISEGIKPNAEKIQEISKEIYSNAMKNYVAYLDKSVMNSDGNKAKVDSETSELIKGFNELSDSDKASILKDIEIDGIKVNVEDQIAFLEIVNSMNDSLVTEDLLKLLDKLPESIKALVEPKMNMSKEKRKEVLLRNFEIIKDNFEKNGLEFAPTIGKMIEIDKETAIDMWLFLLKKHE